MLYLNWKISLIVFSMLPFIVIFTVIFQKKILAASREVMGFNSKLTAAYNEGITGVRTIRSLATEKEFINKFEQMSQELFIVSKKRVVATAVFIPLTIGSTDIGRGLLLWFGTEAVLAGKMSLGILIILSVYTRFFSDNLLFFSGTLSRIQPGLASQDRLYRIFNSPTEIENSHEVQKKISVSQGLDNPDLAEYGKTSHIRNIEFKNINFEYKENEPVLHDFNLKVAQGESIALVGETGAGKTTIVSLLCRFYEPISGEICINDLDYRKRSLNWLRSNLGVVLQTSYLF
jgi:ATP-binding cassette, subfamily B, bacterial